MKLFVNDEEITIHHGAKVVDAIRTYYVLQNKKFPKELPSVMDNYGNTVTLDGELGEGNHLYIKFKNKIKMKTILAKLKAIFGVVVLSTYFLMGCSSSQKAVVQQQLQSKTLEIVAVNDMHAALDNFPRFAFIVDSLRMIYPNLLLVSGGDNQTGNPVNDQYPEKGMPIIELMNAVNFDLSAVGNHEFDSRLTGFEKITHKASFDFLCANIELPKETDFRIKPYKIVKTPNGLKTAFVSFLDINDNGIPDTHPDNVKGFVFNDPFQVANDYLFLKDSCDVFVMVNHMGFEEDVKVANQLPSKIVDVIIGGHSHTKVEKDQIHNGIMITQAERKLNYATLIKLVVNSEGKVDREMQLLNVGKNGNSRSDIQAMVDVYNNNPALTEIIATAEDDFSSYEEVGYLMCDAIRISVGADIALTNPGGVRMPSLVKGPVRTKDAYEIDPFGNEMVLFKLSGHEMRSLFFNAFKFDENLPIYPSGISTRYILNSDGKLKDVELFTTEGKPLDMEKSYSVVISNYMASVYKYDHKDVGQGLFRTTAEATIDYLKELKNIPSYRGMQRVEIVK